MSRRSAAALAEDAAARALTSSSAACFTSTADRVGEAGTSSPWATMAASRAWRTYEACSLAMVPLQLLWMTTAA